MPCSRRPRGSWRAPRLRTRPSCRICRQSTRTRWMRSRSSRRTPLLRLSFLRQPPRRLTPPLRRLPRTRCKARLGFLGGGRNGLCVFSYTLHDESGLAQGFLTGGRVLPHFCPPFFTEEESDADMKLGDQIPTAGNLPTADANAYSSSWWPMVSQVSRSRKELNELAGLRGIFFVYICLQLVKK